jgi:glycosyltransferase involved in cell wall biosynthesis
MGLDRNLTNRMMSEKKRVLLVAPLPPPDHGGISNWSRIVRKTLAESPDWDLQFVDIAARYRKATNRSLLARLTGGSIHAMKTLASVCLAMKRLHPLAVHVCTSGGLASPRDVLTLKIIRHFGVPSLIHYRMGEIPRIFAEKGREWRWTLAAMMQADVVVTLDIRSEACVRKCLPDKRVLTLPNLVEIDALDAIAAKPDDSRIGRDGFHVTFVGQIVPKKGVLELVKAAAKFACKGLHLNLVGPVSTSFLGQLKTTAAASGSVDWFHHHGSQPHDDAVRMMASSDVVALPSYTEGFPNVIAEAMALGKPILASAVGAIPEMLDIGGPEECGIVVPPQKIEPLADALDRLLTKSDFREDLGKKARQRAERLFSVPVASRLLTDLWDSIIGKKRIPTTPSRSM